MEFKWASSLEKIFFKPDLELPEYSSASALQGEVFSVQLAYKPEVSLNTMEIELISEISDLVEVRQVLSIKADYFGENVDKENILDDRPGLYPDLLGDPGTYRSVCRIWQPLWLTVRIPAGFAPGKYTLQFKFKHTNPYRPERDFEMLSPVFTLEVLPAFLPPADLKVTNWFHCDSICSYYQVEAWSDEFFRLVRNCFENMLRHGQNMIYVPMFTPPLDTYIGHERMTIQSIQVQVDDDGSYHFDFSRLERYVNLALDCGMKYLEFSHMFTQWGAKCTPKIMVTLPDGTEVRRFGWDVEANDPRYREFLEALMPELGKFLQQKGWLDKAYFHISDEPCEKNLATYQFASELFRANLPGAKFIDALSKPEFYERGLVSIPVPANNHLQDFAHLDIPERWTYYCVSQYLKVPNQFVHMPSLLNRILGILLYIYNIKGFLHWAYNFYFSQFALFPIDPYVDATAAHGFPAGDAFKVYPGKDGKPVDSIRHELFFEGVQDLAALQQLEKISSRDEVLEFIKAECGGTLPTMFEYPRKSAWLLEFRRKLNRKLAVK
jgi:hypothetical protein